MDKATERLHVVAVSLDCPDHQVLASFYVRLLDGELLWTHQNASAVRSGALVLVTQQSADYQKPAWPGASIVHLDLNGDGELDRLVDRALALGAQLAQPQPDPRWRVLLDPAGHPFCITSFSP
jgi:hypothetical protein